MLFFSIDAWEETYSLYGRDVFVHRMQIQESGVIVGQHVYFDVELNNKGHPQVICGIGGEIGR
ncbi:unnamed protein product [Symbiodinium sp. CCMP2592]|nr:unnamed protein product [Symbiodinium sp. CCMP2592]